MQPETRYAKSGDYSIAYQVVGDGPIDLVLAPGFISNVHALLERRQLLDRHRIGQAGAALVEADEPRELRKRVNICACNGLFKRLRRNDLLKSHNGAVRRELARFRGCDIKTTGDGFLATFDGPGRAIRCAHAIVDAARHLGIEIRAGLHTGECELLGEDIGGIAAHIAARVAGKAGPGEVLVSRMVKDLVSGSGISFEDRGRHAMKGVPGKFDLYAAIE